MRTCTLPAIGHHPLHRSGEPHNYIGEIDFRADLDLGAVAVLGSGETPMVYLLDISDRSNPTVHSRISEVNSYIVDVKLSRDGDLLFTSSQTAAQVPELEDATDYTASYGFNVYDISDPTQPALLASHPDPQLGCHMMSHATISGVDWLFCVSQNIKAYPLARTPGAVMVGPPTTYFPNEDGVPTPGQVRVPSPIPPVDDPTGQLASRPHDVTLQVDPATGNTYAIVSHWDAGLRIVDVTNMPAMVEVAAWKGEGATHYGGNVHTAMMFYVGTDRYVAASPEYTSAGTVPSLWIFNANDWSDLSLVAEWYHPGEYDSQGLFLTTHQWQVAPTGADVDAADVRFYLSYNHAGVWVLDLGQILAGDNQAAILGYNLARAELDPDVEVGNAVLNTWDVNVVDGYIYGSDRATGLWIFHYQEDELGDGRVSGFA